MIGWLIVGMANDLSGLSSVGFCRHCNGLTLEAIYFLKYTASPSIDGYIEVRCPECITKFCTTILSEKYSTKAIKTAS
jgi:phage FluMu protein Com